MPVPSRTTRHGNRRPESRSFLPLIKDCDNVKISSSSYKGKLAAFCLSGDSESLKAPVGLLLPVVVESLKTDNKKSKGEKHRPSWVFISNKSNRITHVHFAEHLTDRDSRSAALLNLCKGWRKVNPFDKIIDGKMWRGEQYPIYLNPLQPSKDSIACTIERAAAEIFGIPAYGVHMTIYQVPKSPSGKKGEMKIWVPTRARDKQTWPGKLDNSVAGGLPWDMSPFDGIVKEAEEEAKLDEKLVRKYARPAGNVSFFFHKHNVEWLQPEMRYVYDLEIPSNATEAEIKKSFTPQPNDGEVESFEFLPVSKVMSLLLKSARPGEKYKLFKTNSALVLIDFLVRHKCITKESEENYDEIIKRMHGDFDYAEWSKA